MPNSFHVLLQHQESIISLSLWKKFAKILPEYSNFNICKEFHIGKNPKLVSFYFLYKIGHNSI
jgi:hypothetical protein